MRNLIAAIGNGLLFWSLLIQTEQVLFHTNYVAIIFIINTVLGIYGLYIRWLIRTGNQSTLGF